jgi:hypothetical protein
MCLLFVGWGKKGKVKVNDTQLLQELTDSIQREIANI